MSGVLLALPVTARADAAPGATVDQSLPYYVVPLGSKSNSPATEAYSGSMYSNIDPLSYQNTGYFSNNATTVGSNTITSLLLDDITTTTTIGGGNINQITYSYFNNNSSAVSFRVRTRFFAANGPNAGPGTYLTGVTFNMENSQPGSGGRIYFDSSSLGINLGQGTTIWAGVAFDNNNGLYGTTASQLNNLGQLVYDPPTVGSSQDLVFKTSSPTDGNFLYNNPAGNTLNSGTTTYGANLGWEFVGPNTSIAPASWNVDANGTYTTAINWSTGVVPAGYGMSATFGSKITAARTVTVDSDQGVSSLTFNSANRYTLTGPGNIGVGNSSQGGSVSVLLGSHVVDAGIVSHGPLQVNIASGASLTASQWNDSIFSLTKVGTGTLAINRSQTPTLSLSAGTITMIAGGALPSTIGTLTIAGGTSAPTAAINLTDNDIIFGPTVSRATAQAYVNYARHGGQWDRRGITTTSAPANGAVLSVKGIGVITGAEYISVGAGNSFDGVTVNSTNTLLKFTYNGDTDFNGKINADDYGHIDAGYQNQKTVGFVFDWFHGDFDYNGVISADDYALIDAAYQLQSGTLRSALDVLESGTMPSGDVSDSIQQVVDHYNEFGSAYVNAFVSITVPEPLAGSVLGLAAGAMLMRRRRACNRA